MKLDNQYEYLNTREGFNKALNHFKNVSTIIREFADNINLADLLTEAVAEKSLDQEQIPPIIHALLVDKYGYLYESFNLPENISDFTEIWKEVATWKAIDLVITYVHPELGYCVINPKNLAHFEMVVQLKKHEVVTIYAGKFSSPADNICGIGIKAIRDFLSGKKVRSMEPLKKGKYGRKETVQPEKPLKTKTGQVKTRAARKIAQGAKETIPMQAPLQAPVSTAAPVSAPAPAPTGSKKMTPLYAVPVTNELFHNGNVEAWKRVILSYTTKHPGLEVYIFYEGERIHDINALFKWGKVKHGSAILFAVAGENIQDVAKLQRYLRQGASPRFEDFLKFPVNTILKLF